MLVKLWLKSIKMAALLAAVFVHGSPFSEPMSSGYDLVAGMTTASKNLSYTGLVTYEYRGNLRSIKVIHIVRDGKTYERILQMDGPEREVIRRGDDPDCMRAADLLLGGYTLKSDDDNYSHLRDLYDFHIRGDARIAGRLASMVHVIPKDRFRYGYIVAIDKQSGLMLQSVLMNHDGKPMERFQFIDMSIGGSLDNVEWPSLIMSSDGVGESACQQDNHSSLLSAWEPRWRPAGFVLSSYRPVGTDGRESFMYTDGLAVFSVFIDSSERSQSLPSVEANLGATVVVLRKVEFNNRQYAVTVVGEIPDSTATRIAIAMAPMRRVPANP